MVPGARLLLLQMPTNECSRRQLNESLNTHTHTHIHTTHTPYLVHSMCACWLLLSCAVYEARRRLQYFAHAGIHWCTFLIAIMFHYCMSIPCHLECVGVGVGVGVGVDVGVSGWVGGWVWMYVCVCVCVCVGVGS